MAVFHRIPSDIKPAVFGHHAIPNSNDAPPAVGSILSRCASYRVGALPLGLASTEGLGRGWRFANQRQPVATTNDHILEGIDVNAFNARHVDTDAIGAAAHDMVREIPQ